MYFHIVDKKNKPIISGKLVLLMPHTTCSKVHKAMCFLVYMHEVQITQSLFDEWAPKHLKTNKASGSGGIPAGSDYDYIEFSVPEEYRADYGFMVTDHRHTHRE